MNRLKTFALLALLTFLFLFIGGAIAGQGGMVVALLLAGIINLVSYFYSDKLVIKSYKARQLSPDHRVTRLVEQLARRASLPMPKVYIIDQDQPNAFATGRNPQNSAVVVTRGLVNRMTDNELSGVLAHELGHINNRDILIGTIAAIIAGAISYLAWLMRFGAGSRGGNNTGGNLLFFLLALILAPIAASLIRMAISRTREYKADSYGARLSGNPLFLSTALSKLEKWSKRIPMSGNQATSHMFIMNPFSGKAFSNLFSTHPPTQERIRRLKEMAEKDF